MIDLNGKGRVSITNHVNSLILPHVACSEKQGKFIAKYSGIECDQQVAYCVTEPPALDHGPLEEADIQTFELVKSWMINAGFVINCVGGSNRPSMCSFNTPDMRGSCSGFVSDFVGHYSPVALPFLWECEVMSDKEFKAVRKERVERSRLCSYKKMQFVMHNVKRPHTMYTAVNRNSLELHHEIVTYNKALAQKENDRATYILEAIKNNAGLSKAGSDLDDYKCNDCPFMFKCWGKERD